MFHLMKIVSKMILAVAFLAIGTGFQANAAIIAYDGFSSANYTAGPLQGQNYGGTGFEAAGQWYNGGNINAGNSTAALAYSGVASNDTGGAYSVSTGNRVYANLAPSSYLTGNNTYYISVMMKNTAAGSDYRAFELASGIGDTVRILQVGTNGDNGDGGANWGMRVNNVTGALTSVTAASTLDTTVFAVIKLTYSTTAGASSATLWINPTDLSSEAGSGSTNSVTVTGQTFADATNIRFAQYDNYSMSYWDELRIGNTWADVTTVPEPATWGLLVLGLTATAAFRRRKH